MKIRVTMKDPDALIDGVSESMIGLKIAGLSEEENDTIKTKREEEVREELGKYFKYGEYLTVEWDTETKTITVLPVED